MTPTAVATLVLSTAPRRGAGVEGVTTVEAVPAEPDDAGADGDHHQVAREGVLAVLPATRSDDRRADEGGDPGLRWMTYPPEKSTAPFWAKKPPPQSRQALTQ
jgi:hypothetical protein